jgi:hypothetical protein
VLRLHINQAFYFGFTSTENTHAYFSSLHTFSHSTCKHRVYTASKSAAAAAAICSATLSSLNAASTADAVSADVAAAAAASPSGV